MPPASPAIPSWKSGYLWLFLGALLLRWFYLAEAAARNELLTYPLVDAGVYVRWARDILAGHWLWYEAKTYTPGIPLWLAGWFAILGERPLAHFASFHLLGAVQVVVIGKTAEHFWGRRAGLATGWIAAFYWPLILFEATYYAEPFAILNLSLALYLLARWSRSDGDGRWLALAGLCAGASILARANAMLCLPVFAAWAAWVAVEKSRRYAIRAIALLAIGPALLCLPIVAWNWKVTGVAELRTGGFLSVYLGNNPDYRGLVVPVGVRWNDFVYLPIRAGKIDRREQNDYWREAVMRAIRERTGEWLRLMGRKSVMLIGRHEVSQEIDIAAFRQSSRLLSLPIWPGWGVLFPLAMVGAAGLIRSRDTRRDAALLVLCAVVYMLSVAPVQAAGRYRLPVVVPMLPLAGWAVIHLIGLVRGRAWPALGKSLALAGVAAVIAWPDWLDLSQEKIINHAFLTGLKRDEAGDPDGALKAYAAGAAWNPMDPDCPLNAGRIELRRQDFEKARAHFLRSLEVYPNGHEATIGLAECALGTGQPDEALRHLEVALRIAPNHLEALGVAVRAFSEQRNWGKAAEACALMRNAPAYPASIAFIEARALTLAGQPAAPLALFEAVAMEPWHSPLERARAAFLAGTLSWRLPGRRAQAMEHWRRLAAGPPGLFQSLGRMLAGQTTPEAVLAALPAELRDRGEPHVSYALAMAAVQQRDREEAIRRLTAIVDRRNAAELPVEKRELLEIWALEDLSRARPEAAPR